MTGQDEPFGPTAGRQSPAATRLRALSFSPYFGQNEQVLTEWQQFQVVPPLDRPFYRRVERRLLAHSVEKLDQTADLMRRVELFAMTIAWASLFFGPLARHAPRTEERRVGTEGVSTCRSGWVAGF